MRAARRAAGPFIFNGTHKLKDSKFEDFKANMAALANVVEANEPRIIAFNAYANDDGTEVSVVQVHPHPESMMVHMQVVRSAHHGRLTPNRWTRRQA